MFTAACVLLLARDGAISLEDPVARYVPDVPAVDDNATIEQFLNHTSGIGNFIQAMPVLPHPWPSLSYDDIMGMARLQGRLGRAGERFDYNNTDVVVLATALRARRGPAVCRPAGGARAAAARHARHVRGRRRWLVARTHGARLLRAEPGVLGSADRRQHAARLLDRLGGRQHRLVARRHAALGAMPGGRVQCARVAGTRTSRPASPTPAPASRSGSCRAPMVAAWKAGPGADARSGVIAAPSSAITRARSSSRARASR